MSMSSSSQITSPKWTRSSSRIPRYRKSPSPLAYNYGDMYSPLHCASLGLIMAPGPLSSVVMNHSFGSLEASGGESMPTVEIEQSDLQNRLSDFQYKNKILIEDNQKLQKQLENSEETVADLKDELECLQKKIWNLQAVHERCRDPKSEIDELKSEILSKEDIIQGQQTRIKDLDKQIHVSSDDFDEMKFKYERTKDLYYELISQHENAQVLLEDYQEKIHELETSQTSELNRSNAEKLSEVQQRNEILVSEIDALKKQNEDLEWQINQLQQQMIRDIMNTKSVEVNSDSDTECSTQLPGTPGPRPNDKNHNIVHSTPLLEMSRNRTTPLLQLSRHHSQSLHAELKSALYDDEDDFQQSPLCERSMDNIHSISILEQSFEDSETQFSEMKTSLITRQKDFSKKLISEFNFARSVLEKDLEILVENSKNHVIFERPTMRFKTKFKRVLSRYLGQLEKLDIVNDNADIILGNLMQFLGKVQDEKIELLFEKQNIQELIGNDKKPVREYITELHTEIEQMTRKIEHQRMANGTLMDENRELQLRCEYLNERLEQMSEIMRGQSNLQPDLLNEAPILNLSVPEADEPLARSSVSHYDVTSAPPELRRRRHNSAQVQSTDSSPNSELRSSKSNTGRRSYASCKVCLLFTALFLALLVLYIIAGVASIVFSGRLPEGRAPWFLDVKRTRGPVPF